MAMEIDSLPVPLLRTFKAQAQDRELSYRVDRLDRLLDFGSVKGSPTKDVECVLR